MGICELLVSTGKNWVLGEESRFAFSGGLEVCTLLLVTTCEGVAVLQVFSRAVCFTHQVAAGSAKLEPRGTDSKDVEMLCVMYSCINEIV